MVTTKRGRKSAKAIENEKATILGLLTTAVSSIYGAVAIFAGEHWMAEPAESQLIAGRLNDALQTLPASKYVFIKSYFENVAPWVALALALYAVTADKWERHAAIQRERQTRSTNPPVVVDNNGDGRARQGDDEHDPRLAYPLAPVSL